MCRLFRSTLPHLLTATLAGIVGAILITRSSAASTVTVHGSLDDGMVDVNGEPVNLSNPVIRPGTGGNDTRGQVGIFLFQLPPNLNSSDIAGAQLNLSLLGRDGTPEFDLDMYGLGVRSTTIISSGDYYAGPAGNGRGLLLKSRIVSPNSVPGLIQLDIGEHLRSILNSAGQADSVLAFRLNPNVALPVHSEPIRGYLFATADNSDPTVVPTLSISVPEPTTISLGVVLAGCALAWRRQFRRVLHAKLTTDTSLAGETG